jgi:hypothetical protein
MKLADNLWIEGTYYLDFDRLGQFRIIGPGNHLVFATVGLYQKDLDIQSVRQAGDEVEVRGVIKKSSVFFHDPAQGHIRKLRRYTELPGLPSPTYAKVIKEHPGELAPNYTSDQVSDKLTEITYKRTYHKHWYGVKLWFDDSVRVQRDERQCGYHLKTNRTEISFTLMTDSDAKPQAPLKEIVQSVPPIADEHLAGLWQRTTVEVEHLIRSNKTSGVEYGTIFPRDWMEAADLGEGDITPQALNFMYHKALEFIDDEGQGWHENTIGEFAFEQGRELGDITSGLDELAPSDHPLVQSIRHVVDQLSRLYINREMIDIEPHYLLGLDRLEVATLGREDASRLRRAARYVLRQAEAHDLITFKRLPVFMKRHRDEEQFAPAGNWRDSTDAFKMVHPVIAPYDVNVVFYPQALERIRKHAEWLRVDQAEVERLIQKWQRVREWYRFVNSDGQAGYVLALYDVQFDGEGMEYRQLQVNHIDEAYDLFYGMPTEADIVSFCRRLLDPQYFFTASGPTLVGANDGYSTEDYHGRVIWTKQTAFTMAGLERQLKLAGSGWQAITRKLVLETLGEIGQTTLKAFKELGAIPELHYDDNGKARFFTDQATAKGPMNVVQLWSAVGARRIIRAYLEATKQNESHNVYHGTRRANRRRGAPSHH